jgi:predicted nicotinamide N-methyase
VTGPQGSGIRDFVIANTDWSAPPHTPEIRLRLATDMVPIWRMSEEALAEMGVPPPYWAFAWAGGQAVARHLLDQPDLVRGKRVLDCGSGSGLCAIAAMMSGAAQTTASDIDAYAVAAIRINAEAAGVSVTATTDDVIGTDAGWQVVLIGDLFYEKPLADRVEAWCRALAARGALVLVGDPGRTYLPRTGLTRLAQYEVVTTRELEDNEVRRTGVYRVEP